MSAIGIYDTDSEDERDAQVVHSAGTSSYETMSNTGAGDADEDSLWEGDHAVSDQTTERRQSSGDSGETSIATQAAKAIDAAWRPPTPPQPRQRVLVYVDEETPILDAGPAPPDYAAATAWRTSQPPSRAAEQPVYAIASVESPQQAGADLESFENEDIELDAGEIKEVEDFLICCNRTIYDGRRKYRARRWVCIIVTGFTLGFLIGVFLAVVDWATTSGRNAPAAEPIQKVLHTATL